MEVWIYAAVEGGEVDVLRAQPGAFDPSSRIIVVQANTEPAPPGIQVGVQYRLRLSPPGRIFPIECTGSEGLSFSFYFETDPSLPLEPIKPPPTPAEVPFKSLETPELKKFLKWALEHGDRTEIEEGVNGIFDDLRVLVELGDLAVSELRAFLESVVDLFNQIADPDVRADVTDATTEMVEATAQEIEQATDPDGNPGGDDGNGEGDGTDGTDSGEIVDTGNGEGGDGTGDTGEIDGTGDEVGVGTDPGGEATDGIVETDPPDPGGEPGGSESSGSGGDGGGGGGEPDFGNEKIPRMMVAEPNEFDEMEEEDE
jgi:hypothetical protein